jgi:16S rRNA (cytosine1402-N4)-methyltransferase
MNHIPVLLEEVITALKPFSGGVYIDATLGDGGHTKAILDASSPNGKVIGIDQSAQQLEVAKQQLLPYSNNIVLEQARFSELKQVAERQEISQVDGILFDLGISSRQLSDPSSGLGFADATPLDMRLAPGLRDTAADFLNRASEQEIADILYLFGDRHNSRTLASKIVTFRRKRTFKVAHDLKEAINLWRPAQLAPIFQALRIWVNKEYDEIESALPQAVALLKPGGALLVISFHSGEDRLVKQFMQANRELLQVSKKVIVPTFSQIKQNPRSRSAKLRIGYKLTQRLEKV